MDPLRLPDTQPSDLTQTQSMEPILSNEGEQESSPDFSALMDIVMKAAPAVLSSISQPEEMQNPQAGQLAGLLASLLGENKTVSDGFGQQESVQPTLPIAAGQSSGIQQRPSEQKTRLLKALKPYMRKERAEKIDRAISMLDTAYAAKSALGLLGSLNAKKQ